MNIKISTAIILLLIVFAQFVYSQSVKNINKQENDMPITVHSDSLHVAYTYWWSQSGPFIGLCGDEYSLAFLGIVKEIDEPIKDSTSLYISQKGSVEIVEVLKSEKLKKEEYQNQKYFISDCFYNLNLKKGDKVMVFCYEYEGRYSIPGKKSIIKISSYDNTIVKSIKKYIQANQDPYAIKAEWEIWRKLNFGNELKQIIKCDDKQNKSK